MCSEKGRGVIVHRSTKRSKHLKIISCFLAACVHVMIVLFVSDVQGILLVKFLAVNIIQILGAAVLLLSSCINAV